MPLSHMELGPKIRAQLAIQTAFVGIIILVVMSVIGYFFKDLSPFKIVIRLIFVLGMSVLIYLTHRGVPGSIHAIVIGGFFLTGLVIYSQGTILVPATSILMVLIVITAILLGNLGIAIAAVLSFMIIATMLWLQINGIIAPVMTGPTWSQLGTYSFFIVATSMLSHYFVTHIRKNNLEMAMRIQQNEKLHAELVLLALHDPLTGLYNRRYLNEMLEKEFYRCQREKRPLSTIVVDIDLFKNTNDTYGHKAGDEVLVRLAAYFASAVRASDFCCRYGGEEFVLVMPGADKHNAIARAEAFRQHISQMSIPCEGHSIKVTASFGVATYPTDAANIDDLLNHADAALYQSKQTGRNKVSGFQKPA